MEPYKTILKQGKAEFVEKKSQFIGNSKPVSSEKEALEFIESIKRIHHDATHNVYAYVLKNGVKRFSDDGEPQGTAGIPSLDVIEKMGITDVCVVVTRYFGGIMLGAGGLVRAYSHGARIGIEAGEVVEMTPCVKIKLSFGYELYGKINFILEDYVCRRTGSDFTENITLELLIRSDQLQKLSEQLRELSAGLLLPEILGCEYAAF